jgi:plastocyanin
MKKNQENQAKQAETVAPATYELKVQAIRSKGQQARLYVYFPLPLAAAIGMAAGDKVQWELLDRNELHLVRVNPQPPRATSRHSRHPENHADS